MSIDSVELLRILLLTAGFTGAAVAVFVLIARRQSLASGSGSPSTPERLNQSREMKGSIGEELPRRAVVPLNVVIGVANAVAIVLGGFPSGRTRAPRSDATQSTHRESN
jgi:hypothetical protein